MAIQENDEVEVAGPDVLTSCGVPGQVLQLGTSYVVGIGGACSPIGDWSALDTFNSAELELLRELSDPRGTAESATASYSVTDASTVPATSQAVVVISVIMTAASLVATFI